MKARITTQLIMAEAERRGWKVRVVSELPNLVEYTSPAGDSFLLNSNLVPQATAIDMMIAENKWLINKFAPEWQVPTPLTQDYTDDTSAEAMLKAQDTLVVKPISAAHGHGVTTGVTTNAELQVAIRFAKQYSSYVLLQKQAFGSDYRLLFIDGTCVAAAVRTPAMVTGDGTNTIRRLIALENQSSERGTDYQKRLNVIDVEAAERFLGAAMDEVPASGQTRQVVGTANIGRGGTATDVTDDIPPQMLEYADRIATRVPLPVCGMDFIDDATEGPLLIEINSRPSFGLHTFPTTGTPRNVSAHLLDYLERQTLKQRDILKNK